MIMNRCAGFANKMRMNMAAGPKAYLEDSVGKDTRAAGTVEQYVELEYEYISQFLIQSFILLTRMLSKSSGLE
jgi:hypothetical protein